MTEDRYSRQMLFSAIGEMGRKKIQNSTAVIIGCGALGTVKSTSWTNVLCGRNMILVMPPEERPVDLPALARDLSAAGGVPFNGFMLTLKVPPHELTLFPNGRALIKGAADVAEARSLYARYVGI